MRDLPGRAAADSREPRLRGEEGAPRDIWRSVITQQLQADAFAVEMAAQLFQLAPHHDAKLYYSTMVQDESRHTEAWLWLAEDAGGTGERDPHLDRMASMFLDLDTLEEKVFLMQVFFERLIIPRFRMIASASRVTVLEDLCNRSRSTTASTTAPASPMSASCVRRRVGKQKRQLVTVANRMMPMFVDHAWRLKARAFIGAMMQKRDVEMLREDLQEGVASRSRSASTSATSSFLVSLGVELRRWPRKNDADSIRAAGRRS